MVTPIEASAGVAFIVVFLGYLAMLGDSAGQTWHDRAAHSLPRTTLSGAPRLRRRGGRSV